MIRIEAPTPEVKRVGSIRFHEGVATAELITAAEEHYLATRGFRIEEIDDSTFGDAPAESDD